MRFGSTLLVENNGLNSARHWLLGTFELLYSELPFIHGSRSHTRKWMGEGVVYCRRNAESKMSGEKKKKPTYLQVG